MPLFEYKCCSCGHKFEFLHKSSAEDKPKCPNCGSGEVEKLISSFGFCGRSGSSSSCSSCSGGSCSTCGH